MMAARPDGYEYVAANGYKYRKVDGTFVLVHHIIAAEKLGRPHNKSNERVVFKDNNRENLSPDNILVVEKVGGKNKRIETLLAKRATIDEELKDLGYVN
jgi:hypothetical protein